MWVPGHFDQQGNACIKLHICGVAHQEPGVEFEAILDTGFTGFIQLPIQNAFSLKLPLDGTAKYTLADGSSTVCLTALSRVTFDGATVTGVVSLEMQSQEVLVGMDFLRQFKRGLVIAKGLVFLPEEDWLERALKEAQSQEKSESPQGNQDTNKISN